MRSEMNVGEDHRSGLIHPDYKVRVRLSDMGNPSLSSPLLFVSLLQPFRGELRPLLLMPPRLKLCEAIVESVDLFIFYPQLLTAK